MAQGNELTQEQLHQRSNEIEDELQRLWTQEREVREQIQRLDLEHETLQEKLEEIDPPEVWDCEVTVKFFGDDVDWDLSPDNYRDSVMGNWQQAPDYLHMPGVKWDTAVYTKRKVEQ